MCPRNLQNTSVRIVADDDPNPNVWHITPLNRIEDCLKVRTSSRTKDCNL
jgi:hypothetical protein